MTTFSLQTVAGGLAYFYESQVESELDHTLNKTFVEQYAVDSSVTEAIDRVQQKVVKIRVVAGFVKV